MLSKTEFNSQKEIDYTLIQNLKTIDLWNFGVMKKGSEREGPEN